MQLGKELTEYHSIGPHVVVGRKLEAAGHEGVPGAVLSYIVTEGEGSISQWAEPIDAVFLKDYDIEYYVRNQIVSVALRVFRTYLINGSGCNSGFSAATASGFAKSPQRSALATPPGFLLALLVSLENPKFRFRRIYEISSSVLGYGEEDFLGKDTGASRRRSDSGASSNWRAPV